MTRAEIIRVVNTVMADVMEHQFHDLEQAQKTRDATEQMVKVCEGDDAFYLRVLKTFIELAQEPAKSNECLMELCAACYIAMHEVDPKTYPL